MTVISFNRNAPIGEDVEAMLFSIVAAALKNQSFALLLMIGDRFHMFFCCGIGVDLVTS